MSVCEDVDFIVYKVEWRSYMIDASGCNLWDDKSSELTCALLNVLVYYIQIVNEYLIGKSFLAHSSSYFFKDKNSNNVSKL